MFGSRSSSPEGLEGEARNTIDLEGMDELLGRNRTEMAAPVLGNHSRSNSDGSEANARNGISRGNGGRGRLGDVDPNPRGRQYRRPLPQPRPFEGRAEESLDHFFRTYERYAQSAWSDDPCDWVAGLENFLVSWPLTLYRGLIVQGKSYAQINILFDYFNMFIPKCKCRVSSHNT